MRRATLAATAVSALALLTALPAAAQSVGAIAVGDEVTGQLAEGDAEAEDGDAPYRHDDYRFEARQGQRLEAIMRSAAFDALLEVYREGADGEPLARDDDGLGEDTDARLRFAAPEDGVYVLRARTYEGLHAGEYRISLKERAASPPAPEPGRAAVGEKVNGALADGDAELDDGSRHDDWAFTAAAGDRIAVGLESEDFDPVLLIGRADAGGDFVELARNDDAPTGGLNSYLVFTAPEAGSYLARVTALSPAEAGDYSLSLEPGPPPAQTRPIGLGEEVEGELAEDDALNDGGVRFDGYRFSARAGQRISIEMASDDFDTYLALTGPDGALLAEDDDGAGVGTNSRLTHTFETDGDHVVEARAFGGDGTGDYTLELTEVAPEPPPRALGFGQTVQGEIGEDDPKDDAGRGFEAYAFSGVEGQRVQLVMRSGDFDTFLQLGQAGGEFAAIGSDDDGLREGTDSRLIHTLPETGDYVVRVSPLGADAKGLYSLELIDRGPQPRPGSILVGATARGTLTENDALAAQGGYFDAYRFRAKAGEELRITMVSNDFDAVIAIGEDGEEDFSALASDDDSLSDTHAKLMWTAEEDGWYVLRASSFDPGQLGGYALTVERKP